MNTTTVFTHKDELVYCGSGGGSNRHREGVYFETPSGVIKFSGESIPGVVRILNSRYHKNGKWSYTTWELKAVVPTWRRVGGKLWLEGGKLSVRYFSVNSWEEVPPEIPREVLRMACPKTAERLDQNDLPV